MISLVSTLTTTPKGLLWRNWRHWRWGRKFLTYGSRGSIPIVQVLSYGSNIQLDSLDLNHDLEKMIIIQNHLVRARRNISVRDLLKIIYIFFIIIYKRGSNSNKFPCNLELDRERLFILHKGILLGNGILGKYGQKRSNHFLCRIRKGVEPKTMFQTLCII